MGLHFVAQPFTSFGLGLNFGFLALTSINCIFFPASSTSVSYFKCTTITETTKNLSERILFTDGSDVADCHHQCCHQVFEHDPKLVLIYLNARFCCQILQHWSLVCMRTHLINNLIDLQGVKTSNGYNNPAFLRSETAKKQEKQNKSTLLWIFQSGNQY